MDTETLVHQNGTKTSEIAVIANKIESGLEAFEKRKAELIDLKKEAEGLKIQSIDDKVTITRVATIRKKLKTARVEIEKEGKSMRDPLTGISRTISSKEKELVDIIQPTEKELLSQEQWVESEKERIMYEDRIAEEQRIQKRVDRLAAYGFTIDLNFIKSLDDDSFESVVANAKVEHQKELDAKAEKLKQEQAEKQRLIDERKELEELRMKQAEAQRIIDERNEKIRLEQEEKENAIREEQQRQLKENARIESEKKQIEFNKKRELELEQARKEAAEKERLRLIEIEKHDRLVREEKLAAAGDKVKFQSVITQIGSIKIPEMKSQKSKKLSELVTHQLSSIVNNILAGIK